MNDRELLELAAKAAGIEEGIGGAFWTEFGVFDPLTDDGDALRLAVKLGIRILADSGIDGCVAAQIYLSTLSLKSIWVDELAEPDPHAATRRAIVRAAAEIGKKMK